MLNISTISTGNSESLKLLSAVLSEQKAHCNKCHLHSTCHRKQQVRVVDADEVCGLEDMYIWHFLGGMGCNLLINSLTGPTVPL